jgi:hypothetical protein
MPTSKVKKRGNLAVDRIVRAGNKTDNQDRNRQGVTAGRAELLIETANIAVVKMDIRLLRPLRHRSR